MYQRIILLILFPLFGFSQAPQKINFQSILRNSSGEVVANKNVKLKISIQSGSMMDTTVYSETHLKTTDASGLMSLKIGTGTVIMGRFDSIKWGKAPHFIKLEADFNGGNSFVLLGTQELMSVPYAFHSNTADSLVGGMNFYYDIINLNNNVIYLSEKVNSLEERVTTLEQSSTSLIENKLFIFNYLNSIENQIPLTDIDGNTYQKVIIGSQIWMKENLRVSRYRNGDPIPIVTDKTAWSYVSSGARCWYNNDSTSYEIPYGNLYNWHSVADNRNICPTGWHVPSNTEVTTLINYLGGPFVAGGKMKSIGTDFWISPNEGATNESGFSGLPGGVRDNNPSFPINRFIGEWGYFWCVSETFPNTGIDAAYMFALINNRVHVDRSGIFPKSYGLSVRCIKN